MGNSKVVCSTSFSHQRLPSFIKIKSISLAHFRTYTIIGNKILVIPSTTDWEISSNANLVPFHFEPEKANNQRGKYTCPAQIYLPCISQQMFWVPLESTKGDLKRRDSLLPMILHLVLGSILETLWVGEKKPKTKKPWIKNLPTLLPLIPSIWYPASSSAEAMCFHRKLSLPYLPSKKMWCFWKDIFFPQTMPCTCRRSRSRKANLGSEISSFGLSANSLLREGIGRRYQNIFPAGGWASNPLGVGMRNPLN